MLNIFNDLYNNLMATTWLEFLAVLFGILSVWFARKENIWVYPTGIINVLIYVYLCYHAGLYADMGINAFYFVMSAYGWYNWARRDRQQEHVHITRLPASGWIYNIILLIISFFLIYQVLVRFTDSTVPGLDSFTTSIFIVGMWLMARKKIENWLAWILGDLLVIPLFAWKGLVFTSIQYIIFLLIAVMGYIKWREIMAQKQVHA